MKCRSTRQRPFCPPTRPAALGVLELDDEDYELLLGRAQPRNARTGQRAEYQRVGPDLEEALWQKNKARAEWVKNARATDPEYVSRSNERNREYMREYSKRPEVREQKNAYMREYLKKQRQAAAIARAALPPKPKMTGSERNALYKARLKQDPKKWAEFLRKERARKAKKSGR